ncbi:unnamed protein product [Kuraishia capsulata CBS 1993]|uniref:Peptidase M16 N-terminal domain-containing protein n=1 Tax=Kuraishia capsulata CBS 1993 TaxID=1382522 RepID=W6MMV6_9ASCO|nr:uncharacterized protein KUCA_T00003506001 [Kuraishia capsulata CBS 1993]CDK27528.1 unnamed protein product [Kuraishia capsulata CBS 1993]
MFSKRFLSTSVAKAKITQLANGLTVATKSVPSSTSTIGLYSAAGSRAENPYNSGVSTLLGSVLAKSAYSSSLASGVIVSSSNSKETTGVTFSFANGALSDALSVFEKTLSTKAVESTFSDAELIKSEAEKAASFSESLEEKPIERVLEHLTSTAFQSTSLALPTYGKAETVGTLEPMDLTSFFGKYFINSNLALVGTGDVDHEKLIEFASKLTFASGVKPVTKPAKFLGSEVRLRDDTLPSAYVAIAAKGESVLSPNYYVAKVAAKVNGSYSTASPFYKLQGGKLADLVSEYHLADTFSHFSTSYSDTGLWGFVTKSSNIDNLDDLIHFTLKDWGRLSTSISEAEIERAKSALKVELLGTEVTPLEASDKLASDALVSGFEASAAEIVSRIDKVTTSDVTKWAQATLYDQDIAVSGTGQIEALFDYNRIRNDMSMMRW